MVEIYAWDHSEAGHLDAYGRAGEEFRERMHCNLPSLQCGGRDAHGDGRASSSE